MPGLLKTTEGSSTTTPLVKDDDAIFTLDELIRRRASQLRDSPLLGYPREGLTDYEEHSAEAIGRYVDAAVEVFQERGLKPADPELEQAPVVGILAHSSLHFIIALLGLSRLGYAALLLSTRLASPAIISLLDQAECNTILTTPQFHDALSEVQSERSITLLEMLSHEDYYGVEAPVFHRTYDPHKEYPKRAVIIHSSGSTGLPKPIYLTHRSCIAAFGTNLDRRALMTQPLFHSFGFYETFRSIYSGKPMYYVNYNYPLTKQGLLATIQHVKPDLLFCVPYVLKLLADSDEGIRCLADIDLIMYGGSACPDDLGDKLVQNGVNVCANYGATETGRVMTSVRPPGDLAWNYLRILPQVQQFLLMDEVAPGLYECVALDGLKSKSTINSNDPPNSFRTRDLFVQHPSNPAFWKYVSRLDDRLTLVNGEKVLPIPIEGRIRQEPLVQEAIVFGDGKTVPGILIIRADAAAHMSDAEFMQHIWPSVEDANSRAESFSRIPQDLVVVLPAGTKYAATDKSTFIRAQVYEQFKQNMEAAYAKFENDAGGTIALPLHELEAYLMRRFAEHLDVTLESTQADFFASGIDSLMCMRMWSLIKKEVDIGGKQSEVGQNLLYETGNVAALARYLDGLRNGTLEEDKDKEQEQAMRDLIAKYSTFETVPQGGEEKHVVLLTGTTGSLGAHLLAHLLSNPSISLIYTPVRAPSDIHALSRVLTSLTSRSLSPPSHLLSKIHALPSSLGSPTLGFPPEVLENLRRTVTLIIHSAWAVNFNVGVQSFEAEHIAAVHHLLHLTSSAPRRPRFYFASSVSVVGGTPRPGRVGEGPVADMAHVQRTGYGRSKYVAESIVLAAARAGVRARVLRIGQLVGDTASGTWNTSEGVPLMMQTAATLGALPEVDEEMSWLPVDWAARIIAEVCGVRSNTAPMATDEEAMGRTDLVYHVLNPNRFHWTRDMLPALKAAGLNFESLPTDQWMARLRASDRDPKKNPPIKLLDWFEGKYGKGATGKKSGVLEFETQETAKASESMRTIPPVTDVGYLKKVVERLRGEWVSG